MIGNALDVRTGGGGTVVFVRNDCEGMIELGQMWKARTRSQLFLVDPALAAPGFGALSSTEWTHSVIC
jgi:hypothetical protein